jgi:hypothetical protein
LTELDPRKQPGRVDIPIVWVGVEDTEILFANQFLVQFNQQEILLTIGQLTPPVILGPVEQQVQQAERLSYIPVKTVGRFGLTRDRLEELIGVLQTTARNFDARDGDAP